MNESKKATLLRDVPNIFSQIAANTITRVMGLQAGIWRFDSQKQEFQMIGNTEKISEDFVQNAKLKRADSIAGCVLDTGNTETVGDIAQDDRWKYKRENRNMGFRSAIISPLSIKGTIIGILDVYFSEPNFQDANCNVNSLDVSRKKAIVESFADQIATAIRQLEGLEKINEVNQFISSQLENYDNLLKEISSLAQKVLECTRVSIFLKDKKSSKLEVKASSQEVARLSFGPGEGVAGQVFRAGKTILVPDVDHFSKFIKPEASSFVVKSMLAAPIKLDNQIVGVICADMDQLDWFDEFDEKLIETLANQATIAIKNYDIYNSTYLRQKTFIEIGKALGGRFYQDENEILELVFNQALNMGRKNLSLALFEPETNKVHFVLASINNEKIDVEKEGWESRINGNGKTEHIIRSRKRLLLSREQLKEKWGFSPRPGDKDYEPDKYPAAWVGVPMKVGKEVIGVIADYRYNQSFKEDDIAALEALAHYAAIAIESARFHRREIEKTKEKLERIWGINNLRQISWMERGLRSTRSVCRIIVPEDPSSRALKYATGFLLQGGLLMTNHHVIATASEAKRSIIEFDYQLDFHRQLKTARYKLDIQKFKTNKELDYTLVGVNARSCSICLDNWGCLDFNQNADPLPGEYVNIIQHPNGGTKQIVLTANEVTSVASPFLKYTTDTMPGSSGSPVFNDLWQVIAIHHAGGDLNHKYYWNEGVLMSAIIEDTKEFWPADGIFSA